MKIQDVKKECLAIVGLSIEFSNSEISSLSRLLTTIDNAVEQGTEAAKVTAMKTGKEYGKCKEIECVIDLKSLIRVRWLLAQLTRNEKSGLFDPADFECESTFGYINSLSK